MSDTERKEIIATIMSAIGDIENTISSQGPQSEDEFQDSIFIDSAIDKLETLAEEIASKSFTTLEVGPGY